MTEKKLCVIIHIDRKETGLKIYKKDFDIMIEILKLIYAQGKTVKYVAHSMNLSSIKFLIKLIDVEKFTVYEINKLVEVLNIHNPIYFFDLQIDRKESNNEQSNI